MKRLPLILTKSNLNLKQKGGWGGGTVSAAAVAPRLRLPSFTHSHSSTSTHPIPLTAPILCSRSPALVRPLLFACSHKPARSFAFARLPPARSFVLVLGPLIRACSRSCPFVWRPFALVCAHMPRLFVLVPIFVWPSFVLVRARSVVCPFSLRVASVRPHLCPLAPLTGPHLCLYQVYG